MRAGFDALKELAERADTKLRLMVEAISILASDVRDTKTEWNTVDDATGMTVLDDGGIKITGAASVDASFATGTANAITSLPGLFTTALAVLAVEWNEANASERELHELTARLDPDTGAGQDVATWRARLYRLDQVEERSLGDLIWTLQPLSSPIDVAAGGSIAEVSFPLLIGSVPPVVGPAPTSNLGPTDPSALPNPTTIVVINALDANGNPATAVAWVGDTSVASASSGTHTVSRFDLSPVADSETSETGVRWKNDGTSVGLPRFTLEGKTFTAKTASFTETSPSNRLDLGAAPTGRIRFKGAGQTGNGTSLVYQIDDFVAGMTTLVDGDFIGEDNTAQGGTDLSALVVQQTYDVQVVLTPNSAGTSTPIARQLGVEELTLSDISDIAEVGNGTYSVDPQTMVSEVPNIDIAIRRDGRRDYSDLATQLLVDSFVGEFQLYYGHPDLARGSWGHIDNYERYTTEALADGFKYQLVASTAKMGREIPVQSGGTETELTYTAQTLKAVYDDLHAQVGVGSRFVGPGIEDAVTTVTRTISKQTRAKTLMEQIALLAGGAVVSSQGRFKFVSLADTPVAEIIPREELIPLQAAPNEDLRMPEVIVPFGWDRTEDDGNGAFIGRKPYSDAQLSAYGRPFDAKVFDEEAAKWIIWDGGVSNAPLSTLADTVGTRTVGWFGSGLRLFTFEVDIPRPWLELGDTLTVPTDKFVAKDPVSSNALRGLLWATGPIVAHNLRGTRFTLWARSLGTGVSSGTTVGVTKSGDDAKKAFRSFDGELQLKSTVGINEGGSVQTISRHIEEGTVLGPDADGDVAVTFSAAYQNAPVISFADLQVIMFNASLGTANDQVLRLQALNVTTAGFTLRAQNVNPGSTTARTDEFVAGNSLTAVDETVEANLDPAVANDDSYTFHYEVHVTALDLSVGGSMSIVVALETNDGGGWVERSTFNYSAVAVAEGGNVTNDWNHEQKAVVVSGMGLNDDVRIKIKTVTPTGAGGSFTVHGFNLATDADASEGVTYTTASDTAESAIPNAGHSVKYIAQEAA